MANSFLRAATCAMASRHRVARFIFSMVRRETTEVSSRWRTRRSDCIVEEEESGLEIECVVMRSNYREL